MIVLDSSFLIGFYNERDAHHSAASSLMKRFLSGEWGKGLLLEYVALEVVTVLLVRRDVNVAAKVGKLLLDAEELDFVFCSGIFSEAFSSFTQQRGTRLSFVDVAIVQVARQRAEGRVLTFDEEFGKITGIHIPE
ncbi:MAG TPA: PIN domain-containing protein [Bryobacteraceae bacterium]